MKRSPKVIRFFNIDVQHAVFLCVLATLIMVIHPKLRRNQFVLAPGQGWFYNVAISISLALLLALVTRVVAKHAGVATQIQDVIVRVSMLIILVIGLWLQIVKNEEPYGLIPAVALTIFGIPAVIKSIWMNRD
jgi:hypothetical protein